MSKNLLEVSDLLVERIIERPFGLRQVSVKSCNYSSSEKDSCLGTPASCRQLIGSESLGAGKMLAFSGNSYLKNYIYRKRWLGNVTFGGVFLIVLGARRWLGMLHRHDMAEGFKSGFLNKNWV